jgi:hypothetical protein
MVSARLGSPNPSSVLEKAIVPRDFYSRSPKAVARDLLKKLLIRHLDGERMTGRIAAIEAYLSKLKIADNGNRPEEIETTPPNWHLKGRRPPLRFLIT